ncbi:DUF3037 domain-containing protein [Listeria booriae]|uniref:DUF3037 domain-containing protein n=1 Tax=Listeria booriae TaxID=1552123 RepID=UPI0016284FD7|nr:DUF3037 domain-containing protein [Listeria booriae]MBC2048188.1 DUF3037 domain-containing protein [Listeria booriae]
MKVQYSILRYRPDTYSGESINIGIAYYNLDTEQKDFKLIKNYNRLWAFDDELDPEFTRISIESFKEDWLSGSLFSSHTSLQDYTRFYVNEFYFSQVATENVTNYDEFIKTSSSYFLSKSMSRKERLNKKEKMVFIESFLEENSHSFSKNVRVEGKYDDPYIFDYLLNENEKPMGIKYISSSKQSLNMLRSLLFYAEHSYNTSVSIVLETDLEHCDIPTKNLLKMATEKNLISLIFDDKIDELLNV